MEIVDTDAERIGYGTDDSRGDGNRGDFRDFFTPKYTSGSSSRCSIFLSISKDVIQEEVHTFLGQFGCAQKPVLPSGVPPPQPAAQVTVKEKFAVVQASRLFERCAVNGEKTSPEHDVKR